MNNISSQRWGMSVRIFLWAAGLIALLPGISRSQQGSQGNTTIFGGAEITFFGSHNFLTGGSGTQPGIIATVRTAPFGILNFASTAGSYTGADNADHVDGYVSKSGTASFIFPVGNNGHYGPFAASANGTTGAYFHADPNVAVVPNPAGGNYPPLPAGAPFSTSSRGPSVNGVSTVEYWDINGATSSSITLTWNAGSNVGTITSNALANLTIVGWDGSKWVVVPSTVDATSVLGGASSLTAGSITTASNITPDTYTAYTLGSTSTPLPLTLLSFTGTRAQNTVQLNWTTTNEVNTDRFDILYNTTGQDDWKAIGSVKSKNAATLNNSYSFTHLTPANGKNMYRLQMIDLDGKFTYSPICVVDFSAGSGVIVYPNPATDYIHIQTSDPGAIKGVRLSDWGGRILLTRFPLNGGGIDVKNMPPGIYLLTIFYQDGRSESHKISVKMQ